MQPTLCSRCKKNVAVVFISKMEGDKTTNEGLCLKCAKELGLPQVDDMMKRMGISDEDLDTLNSEMLQAMSGVENIEDLPGGEDAGEEEEEGKTATFPFLNRLFSGEAAKGGESGGQEESGARSREKERKDPKNGKRKYLENYCISLTQRAQEGKLDPVIGREQEIERVVQILNRRQKNNPCLIGEPGVGKTAIAEGLAQRISKGDVPFKLRNKEVYLLDLTALVAGTQFRGQFESRMKGLIDEVKRLGNIILMIDEVHNIVGAGDAEGSMNAANILKPALSRGEIQVIGATTFNEYRKSIEKDTALERRFQPVTVNEPSIEDSVQILQGLAPKYEQYHGVKISEGILRQAVLLSERYITDRFLPDKAIDLIDEACSDLNLKDPDISRRMEIQRELDDYEKERTMLEEQEEKAEGDYARMAELKSKELQLNTELNSLLEKGDPQLSMENLAHVIELWTKIPAAKIREQEFQRLSQLEVRLKSHIIGQDEAVSALSRSIRRARVGLKDPKRPSGSFIFAGPTGVGKTELAKTLAEFLFDDEDALIRVDMSEFSEKYAASRLFGAPPGYVGYEEGGELTEKVRRKPFSVVLFDEIEKAHPDIFNTLLQVLDDGHLTDGQGRKVDFKNTIIILTTNLGTRDIAKAANTGFNLGANTESSYQRMKDQVSAELKQQFRPEFLNRLDDIIVFKQLTEPQVRQIVDLDVKQLNDRLFDRHMSLELTDAAKDLLAQKGFDPLLGARPLRRVIQRDVEDAISEKILMGELEDGQRVKVDAEGEGILGEFTFTGEAFEEPNTEPAEGEVAAETEAPAESTESTELTESAESVE